MAVRYYDDIIIQKLKKWVPENSKLRVLKPDESKRLFELIANDNNDKPLKLPFIALSRNNDIELLSNTKCLKSFNGLIVGQEQTASVQMNVIPIRVEYQLDIYTKTYEEGDEYLRNFLFKLINCSSLSSKSILLFKLSNPLIAFHSKNSIKVSEKGTISAHVEEGKVPNLVIHVDKMDAFNLGYLMYFFMRACAMSAYLNGVNPFNQPGVEIYKKNMFHLLGKPGF